MTATDADQEAYLRLCIRTILIEDPSIDIDSGEIMSAVDGNCYASVKRHLQSVAASAGITLPVEPVSVKYPISKPAMPKQLNYIKILTRQVVRLGGEVPENGSLSSIEASRVIKRLIAQKSELSRMALVS